MLDNSWLNQRHNAIHMTIRDVDCDHFDVEDYINQLREMNVTVFSFFCGGYVTTYPSKLPEQRISPWLGTDDLTKRLVDTAHRYGIKALAMIDLGQLPKEAGDMHPEWCARDEHGNKVAIEDRLYSTCPNSAFRLEFTRDMVEEIIGRYNVDAIKFGGASYGFGGAICYCKRCRDQYAAYSGGKELPKKRDWSEPNWVEYFRWQNKKTVETVKKLADFVKSISPQMPVLGNATAFGDPSWTMSSPLDMEKIVELQDVLQVEVQERHQAQVYLKPWQSMQFPAETSNFMSHVTEKPVFVVASYFLAWPWRRIAMPYAEQKAYLAQIVAYGGSPMINLSGGPMKVHEDQRGFRAIKEVYQFAYTNREDIEGDQSVARIALIYSQDTLVEYGRDDAMERYVEHIRGAEMAMDEAHIPYDIISIRQFRADMAEKYDMVLLANTAILSEEQATEIHGFAERGGSVIATYETSLYDQQGERRNNFLLSELLGVDYVTHDHVERMQPQLKAMAYQELTTADQGDFARLSSNFEGTTLLPAYGKYLRINMHKGVSKVLEFGPPAQVFPEGFAYALHEGKHDAAIVAHKHPAGGMIIYFTGEADRAYYVTKALDYRQQLLNAIGLCEKRSRQMKVCAPKTVLATLREKNGKRMVHIINQTGGDRYFDEFIPVHDVMVEIFNDDGAYVKAICLSDGRTLDVTQKEGYACVKLDKLTDYEIIRFEKEIS